MAPSSGTVGKGTRDGSKRGLSKDTEYNSRLTEFLRHFLNVPFPETDEDITNRTEEYFDTAEEYGIAPSMDSYTLALGVRARQTLLNWANSAEDGLVQGKFHIDTIKRAKQLINAHLIHSIAAGKVNPIAGIFIATNNDSGYEREANPMNGNMTINMFNNVKSVDELRAGMKGQIPEPDGVIEVVEFEVKE